MLRLPSVCGRTVALAALLAAGAAPAARAQAPAAAPASRVTGADVAFMQGMIPHHAQALDMVALVPSRTTTRGVLLMAERIGVSQRDEIALMNRWLQDHGHGDVGHAGHTDMNGTHHEGQNHGAGHGTGGHAGMDHGAMGHGSAGHAGMDHALMPGMLSPEDMDRLAAASGVDFDRLFLQYMIRHHQGALLMVRDLMAAPGAAQATEVYQFAADVEADQGAEIARMLTLLDVPPLPAPTPARHHP